MDRRSVHRRLVRLLAAVAISSGVLVHVGWADTTSWADTMEPAPFAVSAPDPCYVGCRAVVSADLSVLGTSTRFDVLWDVPADRSDLLGPVSALVCDPLVLLLASPCQVHGPPYGVAGDHTVTVQVSDDLTGVPSTTRSWTLTVLGPPVPSGSVPTSTTGSDAPTVTSTVQPALRPAPEPAAPPGKGGATDIAGAALCAGVAASITCRPGAGARTPGGGDKVSHKGWPRITGIFWKVNDNTGRRKVAGPANDELLGHHGSDRLDGGAGRDVIWGDWDAFDNNMWQRDVLIGGFGNDRIYPSHGTTLVKAGRGDDYIWAYYGKGMIDCGRGYDTVRVRLNGAFKLRGCERIGHFCGFGSDGHGGCRKPGSRITAVRPAPSRPWATTGREPGT
jgi:hypothetical protein